MATVRDELGHLLSKAEDSVIAMSETIADENGTEISEEGLAYIAGQLVPVMLTLQELKKVIEGVE